MRSYNKVKVNSIDKMREGGRVLCFLIEKSKAFCLFLHELMMISKKMNEEELGD